MRARLAAFALVTLATVQAHAVVRLTPAPARLSVNGADVSEHLMLPASSL